MKIGLLPFYLELYDRVCAPALRKTLEKFYARIAAGFRSRALEVVTVPPCRLQNEFAAAVAKMERAKVDALVTLHLAYSPSLESAGILKNTKLPVIVLDTTPDYDFSPSQAPAKIMFNHGIHGVQDMCNLLVRNNKPFLIEAGHWRKSDVLDRVVKRVNAARLAVAMQNARVGQIGQSFAKMGDFAVPLVVLEQKLGVQAVPCNFKYLSRLCKSVSGKEIDNEIKNNERQFAVRAEIAKAHARSARIGLAVRRWIKDKKLTAFTVNFLEVNRSSGLPTVPFLEAGLAMARGTGYAGEGDVLTAALVGALAAVYPATTFTEMFCPDWKRQTIFLSHMGEVNVDLLTGQPALLEYPFVFGDAENPVKPAGRLRAGKAVLVNLAPLPDQKFRLILAPVVMQAIKGKDCFGDSVRGWMKPALSIADFLAAYSRTGGTHHAALVYGGDLRVLNDFGKLMKWETCSIG